jgi:predicted molibdopterin-dependent oxidoreductase YjgC
MINLTIDDKKISVAEGSTILKAAGSVGIAIPTLCYHAKLSPMGACRVCLVDVEGEDRPVASCDTQAREGMVVRTDTDEIKRQREQMVQLMLLHHPLDCPVCDKAGECEVQDITVAMSIMEQKFSSAKPDRRREELSPVIEIWHSRCVMCGRCVQICKEVQGARAIDNVVRSGFDSKVGPSKGDGFACESCGQCLSMCPVGAILDSTFKYSARAWQLDEVDSICTYCSVGCSQKLGVRDNKVYRATVGSFQGYNKGNLCSVGRFSTDALGCDSRLQTPAIRKNGSLEDAEWNDALEFAAQRLKAVSSAGGGASVAGLASARCSNEALYLFQRLMREGLDSDRVDTPASLNNLALIETMGDVFGVPASTATLSDIGEADTILVVDSNVVSTHPVAALDLLRAQSSGSAKVFVTGHRSNKLTTQCAGFARTKPGSEPALLNCLAGALLDSGSLDDAALGQSAEGLDNLRTHAARYPLSEAAASTGVDQSIISEIADAIAASKNFLLVVAPGSMHSALNSAVVRAAVNLAVLKGGMVLSLLKEGNAQGALDMGVTPDFVPGYKESTGAHGGSLEAAEILRSVASGDVKALYLLGGDIQSELALLGLGLDALKSLDLLVVQDVYSGPIAEMAHVVLPAAGHAEREGTYTNSLRIIQRSPAAAKPQGSSRPDTEILDELSHKLGLSPFDSIAAIRDQIAASVPIYEGIREGGAWDYAKVASSARKKLSTVEPAQEASDEAYPYILTFDAALHFGGTSSLQSESLGKLRLDDTIEIGAKDALALGFEDGSIAELKVKGGGTAKLPVSVTPELAEGVVSVALHNYEVIRSLISEVEPSALKGEKGGLIWLADISAG